MCVCVCVLSCIFMYKEESICKLRYTHTYVCISLKNKNHLQKQH